MKTRAKGLAKDQKSASKKAKREVVNDNTEEDEEILSEEEEVQTRSSKKSASSVKKTPKPASSTPSSSSTFSKALQKTSAKKSSIKKVLAEESMEDNVQESHDDDFEAEEREMFHSDDDDQAEYDEDDRMIKLAEKLDSTPVGKTPRRRVLQGGSSKENVFAATSSTKVSIADLLGEELGEGKGALKKRLEKVESSRTEEITPALSKVDKDRADRRIGYEQAVTRMDAFEPIVVANRKQNLSFPLNESSMKERPSIQNILPKNMSAHQSEAEQEIMEALRASGLASEKQVLEEEERALKKLDAEEAKKRTSELAKMRALMFYSEQKAKRIKKIKSKTFRKLRKKRLSREEEQALEKLRESDPEAYRAHEEKLAMERAQERMSLRHKNTSKNMRELSRRHKFGADDNDHEAEELRKRMRSVHGDEVGDNMTESGDEADEDALDLARRHLAQVKGETEDDEGEDQPAKGLLSLKFMQRAADKEKQQAIEEAQSLVEALENGSGKRKSKVSAADLAIGKRRFVSDAPLAPQPQSKKNEKQLLFEAPQFSDAEPDDDEEEEAAEEENEKAKNEKQAISATSKGKSSASLIKSVASSSKPSETATSTTNEEEESNPWLASTSNRSNVVDKSSSKKQQQTGQDAVVSIKAVIDQIEANEEDLDEEEMARRKEQKDLVRRAFADVIQEDFAEEQRKLAEEEAEKQEKELAKNSKMPGWGSWVGMGVVEKKKPKPKPVVQLVAPENPRVIVSKRTNKLQKKYQVDAVPYPFTSREQYERSLTEAVGPEWNTQNQFHKKIQPEVTVKVGAIIEPLRLSGKQASANLAPVARKKNMPNRKKL